jgi:hypothetical protein
METIVLKSFINLSSQNIIGVKKSRRMRWAGYEARMG